MGYGLISIINKFVVILVQMGDMLGPLALPGLGPLTSHESFLWNPVPSRVCVNVPHVAMLGP